MASTGEMCAKKQRTKKKLEKSLKDRKKIIKKFAYAYNIHKNNSTLSGALGQCVEQEVAYKQ